MLSTLQKILPTAQIPVPHQVQVRCPSISIWFPTNLSLQVDLHFICIAYHICNIFFCSHHLIKSPGAIWASLSLLNSYCLTEYLVEVLRVLNKCMLNQRSNIRHDKVNSYSGTHKMKAAQLWNNQEVNIGYLKILRNYAWFLAVIIWLWIAFLKKKHHL